LKTGQPGIGFFRRHMQSGGEIFLHCPYGILQERLALFFTFDKLANSFPHNPVRRALTRVSQTPDAIPKFRFQLDWNRLCERCSHRFSHWV
jgi:hypothetical protein